MAALGQYRVHGTECPGTRVQNIDQVQSEDFVGNREIEPDDPHSADALERFFEVRW